MTNPDGAPDQVEGEVSHGPPDGTVVEPAVASRERTEEGAREVVAGPTVVDDVQAAERSPELGWPGPFEEEVPPLFASRTMDGSP